jgi:hypothetical protein
MIHLPILFKDLLCSTKLQAQVAAIVFARGAQHVN